MNVAAILASANPIEHVADHPYLQVHGVTLLSNHVLMQLLAALLLVLIIPAVVRLRRTGDDVKDLSPRGVGNFFEAICDYLRKEVARPVLGEHTDRFIGYIWTVFFFILFCNLLGLLPLLALTKPIFGVPIGGTATGNIYVTATLAICTLLMIVVNGLRYNGMEFVKHFFQGPIFISPMIAGLEVIGLLAKTFALAVRLFANMIAGHILLAVLLSFIGMAGAAGAGLGVVVAVPVVLGSVAINLLELFVAFLQAFIFTFLTTIFIGQAVVIHHEAHGAEHEKAIEH
ncbi:MAG TPA: F0F1 ATP synthase subunit A [Phycisphaerae bacterium]|nr:F0F1 ATP synthase subunit A [Phycisphaerae bacterium]